MKVLLYVKSDGNEQVVNKKLEVLKQHAKLLDDEVFAIKVDLMQVALYDEKMKCSLFEWIEFLQIEKLLVYESRDLSLNPNEIISFNYQLYLGNIACDLILEQENLQEWVVNQKMYEGESII